MRRESFPGLLVAGLWMVVAPLPGHAAYPRSAESQRGMVASAHRYATAAGKRMLAEGGNAVDAAVATAFAISVTLPYSAGIGGGGFLLLREGDSGKIRALDFRERAPLAATRDMYVDDRGEVIPKASTDGYRSVAVPGTVAGLYEVHRRYGRLSWATVLAPAIRLAKAGFDVTGLYAGYVNWRKDVLSRYPASRAIFLKKDGTAYAAGEILRQPDLAATLMRIAKDPRDFYTGRTARLIVDDMAQNGGLITAADLRAYQPTWRQPVCGDYRDHQVCSMPPPSSGGVHLIEMLNMIAPTDLSALGWHHPDALHLLIESMRTAYADRATHLGDPAFVAVPQSALTSKTYAAQRRAEFALDHARKSVDVQAASGGQLSAIESHNTSHLVTVDAAHMAVSLTFTVNYGFGSGVVTPGTGVLLNDEMDDFSAAPGKPNAYGLVGGKANAIAPVKIPLSSMSPTIVTKDGQLELVTGTPGGSTIITTVLQVLVHTIDYGMDPAAAIAAPRLHHQWLPDAVMIEPRAFDAATLEALRNKGHTLKVRESTWGNASAIQVTADGRLLGAADPRGEGTADGL